MYTFRFFKILKDLLSNFSCTVYKIISSDLSCSNFRYDTRGEDKSYKEARHWSDDKVLTGRAFFRGDHDPGRLILESVSNKDQGVYKCRVDFRKAPTRISNVNLNVIGKCKQDS